MNEKELTCPLCDRSNECGINKQDNCWCTQKSVPKELIDQIPPKQLNKSCICANCIDKYNLTLNV